MMYKKSLVLIITVAAVLCCVSVVCASDNVGVTYSFVDDIFGDNSLNIENLIIEKEKYKHTYKNGNVKKHTNYYLDFIINEESDSFGKYSANITTYDKQGNIIKSFVYDIDLPGTQKIKLNHSKKVANVSMVITGEDGSVVYNNTTSAMKVTKNITKDKVSSKKSTQSSSVTYWASSNSDKFHNPGCKWAQKISSRNKVVFHSRSEAINAGYKACKVCNP